MLTRTGLSRQEKIGLIAPAQVTPQARRRRARRRPRFALRPPRTWPTAALALLAVTAVVAALAWNGDERAAPQAEAPAGETPRVFWPLTLPLAAAPPTPPAPPAAPAPQPAVAPDPAPPPLAAAAPLPVHSRTDDPRPAPSTPPGTTTELVHPPGPPSVWVEAEDAELSRGMQVVQGTGASGGERVTFAAFQGDTGTLRARFTVPRTGDYVIWGRVHAPGADANSFFLSVDGGEERAWHAPAARDPFWQWDLASGPEIGDPAYLIPLEAGEHELLLQRREPGIALDGLLITGDLEYRP